MTTHYTIEIPHQSPPGVYEFDGGEAPVIDHYRNGAWCDERFFEFCDDNELPVDSDEAVWAYAAHDLNRFEVFESYAEMLAWAERYASDSRPGGSGGHQSAAVLARVRRMAPEEVL